MKLTDEMLGQAAAEAMDSLMRSLPDPKDCHHEFSPEFERKMVDLMDRYFSQDDLIDPTGIKLTPSWHGKECLGNGENPGIECCCDECAFFLECWPEYDDLPKAKQ